MPSSYEQFLLLRDTLFHQEYENILQEHKVYTPLSLYKNHRAGCREFMSLTGQGEVTLYQLTDAYTRAVKHTYGICLRHKWKANSKEAIGELCNSIRRELKSFNFKHYPWVLTFANIWGWETITTPAAALEIKIGSEAYRWIKEKGKSLESELLIPEFSPVTGDRFDKYLDRLDSIVHNVEADNAICATTIAESRLIFIELQRIHRDLQQ